MNKITLMTLNGIQIYVNNQRVVSNISKKARGILIYLLVTGQEVTRDKLAELFWEDSSIKSAKNNLRHSIWEINKLCDVKIIECKRSLCLINPSIDITADVATLETLYDNYQSIGLDKLKVTIELYQQDFLDGVYFKNITVINDWILMCKNYYQKIYYEIISYIGDQLLGRKEYDESLICYEKLLHINPLHEEIYLKLMQNRIQAQQTIQAITYYNSCSEILRNELNIDPSEELQELYFEIVETRDKINVAPDVKLQRVENSSTVRYFNIEGKSFFEFELCTRIIETVIKHVQFNNLTDDELHTLAYLYLIYPTVEFHRHIDAKVINAMHLDSVVYNGLNILVNYLKKVNSKVIVHNFAFTDKRSKSILQAMDELDKQNEITTLVLN